MACHAIFSETSSFRLHDMALPKRCPVEAEGGGFEPPVPKFEYVSLANWWFQPLTHPSKPIFSERVVQMYAKKTTVQNNRAVKFLLPRNMGLQSHCPRFYLLRSLVLEGGPLYGTTKTFGGRMDVTGILIVLTLTLTLTCRPRLCRFVKKSYICNLCGLRHG